LRPLRLPLLSLLFLPALFVPLVVAGAANSVAPRGQGQTASTANLFLFVSPDCPIANRYVTRYAELARDYASKGVQVRLVYSGGDTSFGEAAFAKWAKERGLQSVSRVRDTNAVLAKQLHATTTPQAIVTDTVGEVRYIGRVDDNADKTLVTRRDARLALDAILAGSGRPPRTQRRCAIDLSSSISVSKTGGGTRSRTSCRSPPS
jgi:hypothetical protein